MTRHCLDYLSTATLRAIVIALAHWPWCWVLRGFLHGVRAELLERDLVAIARQFGGHLCAAPRGMQ
jgi:hypothetical protein